MNSSPSNGGSGSSSPKSGIVERTRTLSNSPLAKKAGEKETDQDSPRQPSPAIPSWVVWRIFGFAISLLVLPVAVFFLGRSLVFSGNTMMSFVASIATVNLILTVAVIFAYMEDDGDESSVKIKNS